MPSVTRRLVQMTGYRELVRKSRVEFERIRAERDWKGGHGGGF